MKKPRTILITGASSGIGEALAREYAPQAHLLVLVGRNEERLRAVAKSCQEVRAQIVVADVTDDRQMEKLIKSLPTLDLLIANAGISGGTALSEEAEREIFATNIGGVLNVVIPAIEKMNAQGGGQIAIMASVAGLRGLPSAPAYSASKACILAYGQALRGSLKDYGISVSTICPGWVRTPLTDQNNFRMPMMISAEKAARIIKEGLDKNKSVIGFPRRIFWLLKLLAFLPAAWTDKLFAALPRR